MNTDALELLNTWLSLRELSASEIQKRFSISEEHVTRDTSYMKLTGLTRFRNWDAHPGQVYFRDGQFVLFYVEDQSGELQELSPNWLREYLGEPTAVLPSRAGKDHKQYVYPQKGLAFSANAAAVSFLEIFPPTSLEGYKSQFYWNPGAFTK